MSAPHPQPLKIVIMAMGGEGGGVLADWLVALAEGAGYLAQTTSVPGVAQRTGATLYYLELFPLAAAHTQRPVLALMPLPGDVDVVLASELMEAGRAVQRGLVTADRTTLITSTHRVLAIAEKVALGDGQVDSAQLMAHVQGSPKQLIAHDMAALAAAHGSVISAALFGALAASQALPFTREQFEATIRASGVGVQASLATFAAAHAAVLKPPEPPQAAAVAAPAWPTSAQPKVQALLDRAAALGLGAGEAAPLLLAGLRRLVDYQDVAYADAYVTRLERFKPLADAALMGDLARHLALWMAYEDTARVADLKTRGSRFERVQREARAKPEQLMGIHEYLHPRVQEVADTLPAPLGRWLLNSGAPRRWLAAFTSQGRVVQTHSLRGFLLLRAVAACAGFRRHSLRFQVEQARIEAWLNDIAACLPQAPALAREMAQAQGLIKGYGDTHERGWRHFELLQARWRAHPAMPPQRLRQLRLAALADEEGVALRQALAQEEGTPA